MSKPFEDLELPEEPEPDRRRRAPQAQARRPDDRDRDPDRPRRPRPPDRPRRGVLPPAQVRLICFVILTICLIFSGTLIVMSVWGATGEWGTLKAVATFAVIAFMTGGFTVLNEMFGGTIGNDADDRRGQ